MGEKYGGKVHMWYVACLDGEHLYCRDTTTFVTDTILSDEVRDPTYFASEPHARPLLDLEAALLLGGLEVALRLP